MKSNKLIVVLIGLVLLVSLLAFSMSYSLRFNEVAIITTFGDAESAESVQTSPGLHFKWPAPIQSTKKYDRRMQLVSTRLETQATRDGLQVVTQAFVLWRIDDSQPTNVLQFNDAVGSMDQANTMIEQRMRSAVSALSEYDFLDLIGENNKLAEAETAIGDRLMGGGSGDSLSLAQLGIKIEKVGLSQVLLPVGTSKAVIERMQTERLSRAEQVRNQAASEAAAIESNAAQIATRIRSQADRLANQIRARGDQLASEAIGVMNEEPQLALLLIWLDALEQTTVGTSTFIMPPTVAPWHLLDLQNENLSGSVPQPDGRITAPGVSSNAGDTEQVVDRDRIADTEGN